MERNRPIQDAQVAQEREMLLRLAEGRRKRMQPNGRPKFDLTREEAMRSSRTACRLAGMKV